MSSLRVLPSRHRAAAAFHDEIGGVYEAVSRGAHSDGSDDPGCPANETPSDVFSDVFKNRRRRIVLSFMVAYLSMAAMTFCSVIVVAASVSIALFQLFRGCA